MRKKKDIITLTKEQKENAIEAIRDYILDNFELEIGNLQSDMFLDFITEHIGVYYYNKAVIDSLSAMTDKVDDLYLLLKDEPERDKMR